MNRNSASAKGGIDVNRLERCEFAPAAARSKLGGYLGLVDELVASLVEAREEALRAQEEETRYLLPENSTVLVNFSGVRSPGSHEGRDSASRSEMVPAASLDPWEGRAGEARS